LTNIGGIVIVNVASVEHGRKTQSKSIPLLRYATVGAGGGGGGSGGGGKSRGGGRARVFATGSRGPARITVRIRGGGEVDGGGDGGVDSEDEVDSGGDTGTGTTRGVVSAQSPRSMMKAGVDESGGVEADVSGGSSSGVHLSLHMDKSIAESSSS